MSPQEYDRLARLIADPPKGSKLAAAKEFGIDLTLLLENLRRTPTERVDAWLSALAFHEELQRAGQASRKP
jgi:hypothetical protein